MNGTNVAKGALFFLGGMLVGGAAMHTYLTKHNVDKKTVENDTSVSYIEIKQVTNENGDNSVESNSESETSIGEDSDKPGSESDRERVSEFLQNTEYVEHNKKLDFKTKDSFQKYKASALDTSWEEKSKKLDDVVISSDLDEDYKVYEGIRIVDALEFVKAVASGMEMRSFIFDPLSQKLYWNFTNEPVSDMDITLHIGAEIYSDIMQESNNHPQHWIKTKFLFNPNDHTYAKIECGSVI